MDEVSWRVIEEGVQSVRERLTRAARILDGAGVPFAVVGGNAVAAWVSRVDAAAVRNTRDVDILLRRGDFAAAKAALEGDGFVYRSVAALGWAGTLDVFLDGPAGSVRDALHIVWANEPVTADSPLPAPDPAEAEDCGGVRLIALDALLRMKLAAFRDKDRVHVRDLIEVGLVGEKEVAGLPEVLQKRLRTLLDDPGG